MNERIARKLDQIATRYAAKPKVSAMAFAIEQPSTGFSWGFGNTDQPFSIASITKLYTVAIIMQLCEEGSFTLDTPVATLLGADSMRGLVVHNGHDYGTEITVRELLAHRSGISDYFEQKRPDGRTFLEDALRADAFVSFEQIIEMARGIPSKFIPSTPGKALYSDTNYALLGRIIEITTSSSYHQSSSHSVWKRLGYSPRSPWTGTPSWLRFCTVTNPCTFRRRSPRPPPPER